MKYKNSHTEPTIVKTADWQYPNEALRGLLHGKNIGTQITLIRY